MKKITLIVGLLFMAQFAKAQDTCGTASPITAAGLYVVAGIDGTEVPGPVCTENGAVPSTRPPAGEWYAYTPTQDYTVTVSTNIAENNPRVDTRFHVYSGTCGNLACYAGDDDSGLNFSSMSTFNVTANTTYYIAFDNRWTSGGFTFQVIENPIVIPPATPVTYNTLNIPSITSQYNMCLVDMNGDHKDDIVGVSTGSLKIHYQQPGGTFTITEFAVPGSSKMPGWSMAAGDMNKDGYNDLLLGAGNGLTFWKSNATGTAYVSQNPGDDIFCQRTNYADLNNDGHLDAFSCHDIAPNCYYLNDGNNNFTFYQSTITPNAMNFGSIGGNYATIFIDYDNDGDSDVFVSKCSGPPCEVHRNDGNGVYTDVSAQAGINVTPISSWSSAIADFDNDGDMDIIIGSNGGVRTKFFRNNLDTSNNVEEAFTDITSGSGWDTDTSTNRDYIAYDFDNDGWVDVMGGGNKIMFNMHNGTFGSVAYPGVGIGPIGDVNNDGFLDIQNGSNIRLAVPNGNNWIKVTLNGIASNSNGIGARVEIYGAWGKQIRDVRAGEGFTYASTLNAHFGIGTATEIEKIIIRWPSGEIDTINNPTINQTVNVIEGTTLATSNYTNTEFTLYPNPAQNFINVKWNAATHNLTSAQIFDLQGRLVSKAALTNQKVAVDQLQTGTYILLLRDDSGNAYTQKFIKG
jgi:hypothetical protein